MSMSDDYVQHRRLELHGFVVLDATVTRDGARDDLIRIAYGSEGRWLSPKAASELAERISSVVADHLERLDPTEFEEPPPWGPAPEFTPEQTLLHRAMGHLGTGFRLTCLAAPQYSAGGADELIRAQELLFDLAKLLRQG
jgi:hypothetical protein